MATYTMDKFTYGGNTYVLQDSGALQLTGGNVTGPVNFGDSVSMDDLTTGQLIVTGNASFANHINANTITATTPAVGDNSTNVATTAFVTSALSGLTGPMMFIGTVGTGGTATSLPTAAAANKGYTYKVITALTTPVAAKVGDTVVSTGSTWVVIPSGDEPSGTVTNVAVSNGGGLSVSGSPITSSGTITISHADTSSQNSVTANGRKYITGITLDTYGHVTGLTTGTETVTDTDTHYTANLITGASAAATANAANTATNSIYLNLIENSTVRNSHNIVGSGATTVSCDANGKITISSTDTKVTQAYSTTNSSYPLLMTATSGVSSTTTRGDTTAILNNSLYANPSTGAIYSKKLMGSGTELIIASNIIRLRNRNESNSVADSSFPYITQLKMGDGDYILFSEYNDDDLSIRGNSILLTTRAQPPVYSASSTYSVGTYVWYNQNYYKCTTAITTAEAWDASHWSAAMPMSGIMADANLNPWITGTYSLGTSSYKWSDVQTQKINGTSVPSITAQTTQAIYPIKINAIGMITGYGSAVAVPTKTSDLTNDSGFITSYTDEKLKWTASTSSNTYYPLQSTSTAATSTANTLNSVCFYQYYNTAGGYRRLILGNATDYTSTGGAYGSIKLYGTGMNYYGDLNPGTIGANSLTANRTWTLPDKTGTIALTSDIPIITLNGTATTSPSFYAPTSAGTNGYVLKSNGSGAPSWVSAQLTDTVTTVTASGTGNVVTGMTATNGAITYTMGTVSTTAAQIIRW